MTENTKYQELEIKADNNDEDAIIRLALLYKDGSYQGEKGKEYKDKAAEILKNRIDKPGYSNWEVNQTLFELTGCCPDGDGDMHLAVRNWGPQ